MNYLCTIDVNGLSSLTCGESVGPKLEFRIRMKAFEHPSSLLCRKAMLRLKWTCFLQLLRLSAGVVSAMFAERYVSQHHLVVRLVDLC